MEIESATDLRQWMSRNDVFLSDKIQVKESSLGGTGVFANEKLDEDEILLRVPKDSILSAKTCGAANLLTEAGFGGLHEPLLAYIFEHSQGKSSPWATFIEAVEATPLPDVPRLWSPELKEKLKGTDITFMGGLEEDQLQNSYEEVLPFLEEHIDYFGGQLIGFSQYSEALIRVSSRAFEVDNYHGLALVPGACLFNHSDREHAHFETDGTVCSMCGALECGCIDDDSDWEDAEEGSEKEDDENEEKEEWNGFSDDDDENEVESDEEEQGQDDDSMNESGSDVDMENICELRLIRPVKKGKEIFNTYGEDPNSILMARYGFAIWENANEFVDLGPELIAYVKTNKLKKHLKAWKEGFRQRLNDEQGGSDDDDEQEEAEDIDDEELFVFAVDIDGSPSEALDDFSASLGPDAELIRTLIKKRMQNLHETRSSAELLKKSQEKGLSEREKNIFIYVGTQRLALERALTKLVE